LKTGVGQWRNKDFEKGMTFFRGADFIRPPDAGLEAKLAEAEFFRE
jgi:hypothetical protein